MGVADTRVATSTAAERIGFAVRRRRACACGTRVSTMEVQVPDAHAGVRRLDVTNLADMGSAVLAVKQRQVRKRDGRQNNGHRKGSAGYARMQAGKQQGDHHGGAESESGGARACGVARAS
jgi:hypothetical protein